MQAIAGICGWQIGRDICACGLGSSHRRKNPASWPTDGWDLQPILSTAAGTWSAMGDLPVAAGAANRPAYDLAVIGSALSTIGSSNGLESHCDGQPFGFCAFSVKQRNGLRKE